MTKPHAFIFSSGLNQKFPANLFTVDTSIYDQGPNGIQGCRKEDLFIAKEDFYPIVISIETIYPDSYLGKGRKTIQFTYGSFVNDSPNNLSFKYLK